MENNSVNVLVNWGVGLGAQQRARGDFEVGGISEELCARFSKRHEQIDDALTKLLEEKPGLASGNFKDLRERLATAERSRKQPDLGRTELRRLWWEQITPTEREGLQRLGGQLATHDTTTTKGDVGEAIAWAEEHLFDRHSVVSEHELWLSALGRMRGANVDVDEVKRFTKQRGYVRSEADQRELTVPLVLQREWEIVIAARDGMSVGDALISSLPPLNEKFDDEQREALRRLLQSSDSVSVFRGGAGTGKSFVLGELVKAVQTAHIFSVAACFPAKARCIGAHLQRKSIRFQNHITKNRIRHWRKWRSMYRRCSAPCSFRSASCGFAEAT